MIRSKKERQRHEKNREKTYGEIVRDKEDMRGSERVSKKEKEKI